MLVSSRYDGDQYRLITISIVFCFKIKGNYQLGNIVRRIYYYIYYYKQKFKRPKRKIFKTKSGFFIECPKY
jgi:hypothetical protein